MNGRDISYEMLLRMANHLKKLDIHEYDDFKTCKDWQNLYGEDRLKAVRRVIELGFCPKPRHGDGFQYIVQSYRNSDLLFWHDEKGVVYPYTMMDDYGSVLPDFRVGNGPKEFLPEHWQNIVDHNNIIFLSDELVEQIKTAFQSAEPNPLVNHSYQDKYTSILLEIKDYPYKVVVKNNCKFDSKDLPWATYYRNIIYFQHWN